MFKYNLFFLSFPDTNTTMCVVTTVKMAFFFMFISWSFSDMRLLKSSVTGQVKSEGQKGVKEKCKCTDLR